ncbi:MAG: TRAP transporter large permease subunit, partial [Pseudomonadota bacterium]
GAVGATIMAGYRLHEGHRGAYRPALLSIASVVALALIANIHPINVKNIHTGTDAFVLVLAIMAAGSFVISVVWSGWRTLKIEDTLRGVMIETAKTTSLVFIILLGAAMLTAAFRGFGGEDLVKDFLTGLPGGFWVQFIIVMGVIFVLGFFLDFIEIAVVVVPIVAPILLAEPSANITAVWLGVMIGLNIQTSFLTPPFGFALFYLRGVAPKSVRTIQIYKGVVAFICLQLVGLAIVGATPWMVNFLPNRISLTSDTAPPPQNPKLQYCLEDYLFQQYDARGSELMAAIDKAGRLDLSYLPKDQQKNAAKALDQAAKTFDLVAETRAAEAAVLARADAYRPLLGQVRTIQRDMRRLALESEEINNWISRLASASDEEKAELPDLEARIKELEAAKADLEAQIPESWAEQSKTMQALQQAEAKARKSYRRNVDNAYTPIGEIVAVVGATDRLEAIRGDIEALKDTVRGAEPAEAIKIFKGVEKAVGGIEGARAIRSLLSKARRAIKAKVPDPDKALDFIDKALEAQAAEMAWRAQAKTELLPGLEAYEAAIRDTIGLRQQSRLPVEQVKEIVGCLSQHRDISLYF